jgi:hypothetical protein
VAVERQQDVVELEVATGAHPQIISRPQPQKPVGSQRTGK